LISLGGKLKSRIVVGWTELDWNGLYILPKASKTADKENLWPFSVFMSLK
jgi:hypothetical protein